MPFVKTKKDTDYLKNKYLFYGPPKAGKTTIAANIGDNEHLTAFCCCEPGHRFVSINQWTNSKGKQPTNWMDIVECCRELYDVENHNFSCLVIDTVDIAWDWCTDYICKMNDITHPSEMGFGKAYQAVAKEFSNVFNKLGQQGIGFIFISHEKEYEVQIGPRKESCISTTLSSGAKKFIHGFVDFIWYFSSDLDGNRFILTDRHDNITAGSRGDINGGSLPLKMEMDAEKIKGYLSEL